MNRFARFLVVALMLSTVACSSPYSVLDKTEWLNTERGLRLSIGSAGDAILQNEAKQLDPIELTYANDPENPEYFLFRNERDGEQADFMRVSLPGYTPPSDGGDVKRPEKMEELVVYLAGGALRFVSDTPENRQEFDRQVAFYREQAKKFSIAEAPHETSRYVDVGQKYGANWATYYVLSQSSKETTDEEKLEMLSSKWNSTQNSFERQAMREGELARINAAIAEIGAQEYIALPLSIGQGNPWAGLDGSSGYDFERKGFPLSGSLCGSSTTHYVNENDVSHVVSHKHGADICFLPVDDQIVAQQIEQVRTASGRRINAMRGMAFYKLGPVKGNTVTLLTVGAEFVVGDFFLNEDRTPILTKVTWGVERKQ
ncbi:MAG: hypothetical protein DDT26_00881 [Dehalococcoidia bacterium]|nr:hypothetical protein [Chloroflexota bacterium]